MAKNNAKEMMGNLISEVQKEADITQQEVDTTAEEIVEEMTDEEAEEAGIKPFSLNISKKNTLQSVTFHLEQENINKVKALSKKSGVSKALIYRQLINYALQSMGK